jgi:hypothetical protein
MPQISGEDLELFKSYPQTVTRHLSLAPKTVVCVVRVVGDPRRDDQTLGVYEFDYALISGNPADIVAGQTALIGSSPEISDFGICRVRKVPAGFVFYTEEISVAESHLADGVYLTIIEDYRIWQVKPRLIAVKTGGSSFYNNFLERHDYDIVHDKQNVNVQPQANITESGTRNVKLAGWVDAGQTYRTVQLDASTSVAMKQGATITGYSWDVNGGTIIVGSTSTPQITVRFSIATGVFRWITLTVTDSAGSTHTRRMPLWVHDENNPPFDNFSVVRDDRAESRAMDFEIFGLDTDAGQEFFWDVGLICYWEEAFVGPTQVSVPDSYISQYLGRVDRDTTTLKMVNSRYTITTLSGAGLLNKLQGFVQRLEHRANGESWYEMDVLNVELAVHYILREYSTALTVCNFYPTTVRNAVQTLEWSDSTIWGQAKEVASFSHLSKLGTDSLGNIWMVEDINYLEVGDRTRDTTVIISKDMWGDSQGLVLQTKKQREVGSVTIDGFTYDGTTSTGFRSIGPGRVNSAGDQRSTAPGQYLSVAEGQDKLNKLIGHYWAQQDSLWLEFSITLLGNFDFIEPCWNEPVLVAFSDDNLRDLTVNDQFTVESVSVAHTNEPRRLPKTITVSLKKVTDGLPGETVILETTQPVDDDNPFPDIAAKPAQPEELTGDLEKIAFVYKANSGTKLKIIRTFNFSKRAADGGPDWEIIDAPNSSAPNLYTYAIDGDLDWFSPAYVDGSGYVNAYICGSHQTPPASVVIFGKLLNIFGTPLWTNYQTEVDTNFTNIGGSGGVGFLRSSRRFKNQAYLVTRGYKQSTTDPTYYWMPAKVYRTTNGGVSWTVGKTSYYDIFPDRLLLPGDVGVSVHQNNTVYVSGLASTNAATDPEEDWIFRGYKSANGGATYYSSPPYGLGILQADANNHHEIVLFHIPYHNNTNDRTIYFSILNPHRFYRNSTNITPIVSGTPYVPTYKNAVSSCKIDRNTMIVCGANAANTVVKNFLTRDGGNTWVEMTNFPGGGSYGACAIASNDRNTFFMYNRVTAPHSLIFTRDGGQTWEVKSQNMGTTLTGSQAAFFIAGSP